MAGPIHGTQHADQSSRSSSFAEVSSSSSYTGSPLEAFGDIPPRQTPCMVGHTSTCVDSLARSRIIAVMALNIFVYETPLNAHRDTWVCPFSNCKQSFPDPKAMMSHAAKCTHVSASGAYCNCCGCYYDFPGHRPAFLTKGGDAAPTIAKDSAMTKGKRKIQDFLSRRSGSASSSQEQLTTLNASNACPFFALEWQMDPLPASRKASTFSEISTMGLSPGHQARHGPAELCADPPIAEIGNSSILPGHSGFPSDTNSRMPQRPIQSTVSTISTTGYVEVTVPDFGDVCMSPTEYSSGDNYDNLSQQTYDGSLSYGSGDSSFHSIEQSQHPVQDSTLNVDVPLIEAEAFDFDQFVVPSEESQGLMVDVPNFSRPRLPLSSGQSGQASPSGNHHLHQRVDVIPTAMAHGQHHHGEFFGLPDLPAEEQYCFDVGITSDNAQSLQTQKAAWVTNVAPARLSPRLPVLNPENDGEIICPACDYRPRGAKAYRKANFNKHWKNKHEETLPWICECGRACKRRDNLLVHQRNVCGKPNVRRPLGYQRRKHARRSGLMGRPLLAVA
ncbi:hypothetical protein HYE68_000235 [Fusarium pseudograminearum]|nr:hypothetical protein HYE68_000235 [Fusarium pseudograminearum]